MKAYYYRIYDSKILQKTILEGIIRNSEDTIYPAQEIDNEDYPDLPYECEAHHFQCMGAKLEGFEINIPSDIIYTFKVR